MLYKNVYETFGRNVLGNIHRTCKKLYQNHCKTEPFEKLGLKHNQAIKATHITYEFFIKKKHLENVVKMFGGNVLRKHSLNLQKTLSETL